MENIKTVLPVDVARKIGMIKACGVEVSVVLDKDGIPYNVVIGREINTFTDSAWLRKYIDEKVKEACDGKKL